MDKEAIKKAYKQARQPMGVYAVKILQNDKVFLGFTTDLQARFNRHKSELKFGNHRNRELQELWNSYGESAFKFEILDILDHEDQTQSNMEGELEILAEMWIQKLKQNGDSVVCL